VAVSYYWLHDGEEIFYGKIAPHETVYQKSYIGHKWIVRADEAAGVREFTVGKGRFKVIEENVKISDI
jgi:hypothetical protein